MDIACDELALGSQEVALMGPSGKKPSTPRIPKSLHPRHKLCGAAAGLPDVKTVWGKHPMTEE